MQSRYIRPRRSENTTDGGLMQGRGGGHDRNVAPMPAALAPSALGRAARARRASPRRSRGASPPRADRDRRPRERREHPGRPGWVAGGDGAGSTVTATASAPATTTTAENTDRARARARACRSPGRAGPADRRGQRSSDRAPRRSARTSPISQVRLPATCRRREALDEAGGVERREVVEQPERRLDARHQEEAGVDRRARPRPGGEHTARDRADGVAAAYPAVSTPADASTGGARA